ncbi:MAG: hypothetical protein HY841_09045 [Bacteroidetes bacterium]|nr:hypothetical protein [Bacteroidota bacterium]
MKKIYFKIFSTCCFLFFSCALSLGEGGREAADSLFLAGNYYPAAVEYERAAFLSLNNSTRTFALLKKSECFLQMGNYADAEKITGRIIYTDLSDTLIAKARYQNALCAYLSGNFANAENHLLQMNSFIKDSSLTKNSLPLYALVLNELQRWPEAKEKILQSINLSEINSAEKDSLRKKINELYVSKNYPHLKNLLKAQKMSAFLPGLGQLYAGYFWEGAASAFLNTASLGLMIYLVYPPMQLYFTSATVGTAVFSKFYLGGSNRLEYLVGKKNYKLLRGYNNDLKNAIVKIENEK